MHDKLDAQPQPSTTATADRDLQRASLRDLVTLLTECARAEADIDGRRAEAADEESKRIAQETADVPRRYAARREDLAQKAEARRSEILQKHAGEIDAVERANQSAQVRI